MITPSRSTTTSASSTAQSRQHLLDHHNLVPRTVPPPSPSPRDKSVLVLFESLEQVYDGEGLRRGSGLVGHGTRMMMARGHYGAPVT